MNKNLKERAVIGHVASVLSYPVFDFIVKRNKGLTQAELISLYLFLNHSASKEQLLKLCNYGKDKANSLSVILKRMDERKLIDRSTEGDEGKKISIISLNKKGVENIKNLFAEGFKKAITEDKKIEMLYHSVCGEEKVRPAECVEFLIEKHQKTAIGKKQVFHFIGERELPLALLSDAKYSSPFPFSCSHEVVFDAQGNPISMYEKIYRNLRLPKGEVRSDTVIKLYVSREERDSINLYVEHDTGSQRALVLKSKVEQYATHVLSPVISRRPALLPYVIFSISDKIQEKENTDGNRRELKTKERYLARGISLAASVYLSQKEESYGVVSLYELREFLSSLPLPKKDRDDFLPFLDFCIRKIGGDKNAVDFIDKLYEETKNNDEDDVMRQKYENYYSNRKELLFGSIDDIPGINNLFLAGASICAVSNRYSASVRTFLPECCGMSRVLSRAFSSAASRVNVSRLHTLSRFSLSSGEEIVLRNIYELSDGKVIAVENIGDDYGAYNRIKYMLEKDEAPCDVLCLFSNMDAGKIKAFFQAFQSKKVLSRFYVMSYMVKDEEIKGEKDRMSVVSSVNMSGVVGAGSFLKL